MKTRTVLSLTTTLAAALLVGSLPFAAFGQATPPASPAAAHPVKKVAAQDYLVRCEGTKGVMWASQVDTMHPKPKAVAISKANHNDFLVQVGKQSVWASTIRRDDAAATRPYSHDKDCKDYVVQVGKRSVWASAADCPMGKHAKGVKPLCCVAPVNIDPAKMPRCCKDAQPA